MGLVAYKNPLAGEHYTNGVRYAWNGHDGHKGDDEPASRGTDVGAAGRGHVLAVGHVGTPSAVVMGYDYGNWVAINHPDGNVTFYAHMNSIDVKVGQHIPRAGFKIGEVGMTGGTTAQPVTGYHLHFGVMSEWANLETLCDPSAFLKNRTLGKISARRRKVVSIYNRYHLSYTHATRDKHVADVTEGLASWGNVKTAIRNRAK